MKKSISFIAAMFILFVNCSGAPATPDDLAKAVFDSLKNNAVEDYLKCVPIADDIRGLFTKIESAAESKADKESMRKLKKFMEKELVAGSKTLTEKSKKNFNKIRQKVIDQKIDWKKTEFLQAEYKIKKKKESTVTMETADIDIIFSHEDKKHKMKLSDCRKLGRGWLIGGGLRWSGSGK